jgi:predicted alpha/beta hydrolase
MPTTTQQTLSTPNGYAVQATFFQPDNETKAAALIVPAMGVSQSYYAAFAAWLATQGYLVATFDYAGIGLSNHGDIRKLNLNIIDWARFDCEAVIHAISALAPGKRLYWIGHSLGGQILGFVPARHRIAKAVMIATGSGYWKESILPKWQLWWLWFVVVPLTLCLFGYFPGKRLRKIGDLPRGVMAQWRRWCLNPGYAVGVEGDAVRADFATVTIPITSLSFDDDELMTFRNATSLFACYPNAARSMKHIAPQDVGVQRIGHFGFFKEQVAGGLWGEYLLPELSVADEMR